MRTHRDRSTHLFRYIRLSLLMTGAMLPFLITPAFAQDGSSGGFAPFAAIQSWLSSALDWVDSLGPWGPIAFIAIYIIATVAFIPGSVLTLGAGAIFGIVQGSIYVFVGAMIGLTAAFLIGRYVARDWVAKKIEGNDKFSAIDNAIAEEGYKLMFLIRLSPGFPFNLLNYIMALTKISLKDYIIGATGILPGTIMYVYFGSLLGLAAIQQGERPTLPLPVQIVLGIVIVTLTLYVTKIARQALNSKLGTEEMTS
ncbi:MAG: TVP38/TMEM64 family protein [Synechococcus sp.]